MAFTLLDWCAILGYLAITLLLGLYFRRRSGNTTEDYFVSGTKCVVVARGNVNGGDHLCRGYAIACCGARLHAGHCRELAVVGISAVRNDDRVFIRAIVEAFRTDDGCAVRGNAIHGKPAAFLRGFRAVYLGLMMNCLILGWVTKAMIGIVGTTLGPEMQNWRLLNCFFERAHFNFRPSVFRDGRARVNYLHFFSDSLHRHLCVARRIMGGSLDGFISIRY